MAKPKRRWGRFTLIVVLVVALIGVAGYWYQRPMLLTGTGYAAHNACALHTIAERTDVAADLPPNPLIPLLRSKTDDGVTTASILGVLAKQRAYAMPGHGCTVGQRPTIAASSPVDARPNPFAKEPAPVHDAAVEELLEFAFGTELDAAARAELGTRAVVVLHQGKLIAERYAPGFDATTPQLGWSLTKSVTNLIVGRLIQQELLQLDEAALWPSWSDQRAAITVRDLLGMTSGLEWDETYALNTPITRMLYLEKDMGAYAAAQPAAHAPGEHQQYSSGSTNIVCAVLADRFGGPELFARQLFEPLGLARAVIELDGVGTPVCSSYMWATPREWATIGQFALQEGQWGGQQLLPPEWMSISTTAVEAPAREDEAYGLGWWPVERTDGTLRHAGLPADSYFAQGHDGQLLVVVPSEQLVVVRLGFTPTAEDNRGLETAARFAALVTKR